ncbi:MAG: SDR family NAD(P)-dependent oxidoreductase, partial [Thiotrichaceae bacterium]|nr:SDR family NAD(P)-dependent oxidoreductase [Thiotrichaceae bacterium]
AYNASKYAIEGFADTLRLELSDTNVKVSLVEPGPVESRFRANALQALKDNVNMEESVHRDRYKRTLKRLAKEGNVDPYTLPPEAVLKKVIHALESKSPQAHYYVTIPTYVMGILKRLLPTKLMDKFIMKTAGGEMKD